MTIEPIGSAGIALHLTSADLLPRGLTPQDITQEEALRLVRLAFAQTGISTAGSTIEIDAYPQDDGVLVFARIHTRHSAWFSFSDLEDLLCAARVFPEPLPNALLILWEERYWLHLPDTGSRPLCLLSEFGRRETPPPYFDARMTEHGNVLIPSDAFSILLHYFG